MSTSEQAEHGWSIEQQEDAIRAFAAAQGLHLVAVCRDAGRSGRTMQRRSGLLALIELVAQGGIGVVVTKAQDRLARAVDHALGIRQWCHRHGTDVLFLDGDVHLRAADAQGGGNLGTELIASLTAVLAEEEVATLRRRILPNLAQAARHGRRGGRLPLGYHRQPDGTVVVEPHDADLVVRAAAAVLDGTGVSQLSRTWVAQGVRDHTGAVISFERLRGALLNPFLQGEFRYRLPPEVRSDADPVEVRIPGHHPVLIDPVTADHLRRCIGARAQRAETTEAAPGRQERRRAQRRSQRLPASGDLLAALRPSPRPVHGALPPEVLRCGHCGGPMYASLQTVGGVGKRSRRATYLCRYHKDRGTAFCPQPPAPVASIDEAVGAAVCAQLRSWSLAAAPAAPTSAADAAALAELAAAEQRRDRLAASVAALGSAAPAPLQTRLAEATAAVQRLATVAEGRRHAVPVLAGDAGDFRLRPQATWERLDTAGRRAVLAPLLARVVVRGTAVAAISLRGPDGAVVTVAGSDDAAVAP